MVLIDILGAALTLLSLGFLGLAGCLAALRLLGKRAEDDSLALAIGTLLATTGVGVAIPLLLGALGFLRLPLALFLELLLVVVLLRWPSRLSPEELRVPFARLARRSWELLRDNPALSILALTAVGSEALRGLLRPPLSWDGLMYHLWLAATWLQRGNLQPVLAYLPLNYFGFVPANGSLWLWWWMAPSHSELYANLAFLPQWALLGLATGGIARQLGARKHWPLALFVVLLLPTVVRFAATEYVDIFLAAVFLGGCYFAYSWLGEPRTSDALLAGAGLGLAAGAKVLGAPYGVAFAVALVVLAPGRRGKRLLQVALAAVVVALLGSYFYLRNIAWGAGPLALACGEIGAQPPSAKVVPVLPLANSVLGLDDPRLWHNLSEVFLGIVRPQSMELGIGPPALLLLLLLPLLPFLLPRGSRRLGWITTSHIVFQVVFWLTVPFAASNHVFANVRYLIPGIGMALAGAVALAESRGLDGRWLQALAVVFCAQSLLQMHSEMPTGVRATMAVVDVLCVALAASAGLRGLLRRNLRAVAASLVILALLGVPLLTRFRIADRSRALLNEWTAHTTSARIFAPGWAWLDRHGENGTVAIMAEPGLYFMYPAMGPYFERDVRYVNVNAANIGDAARYPHCNPRIDPSPDAWLRNLRKSGARWLYLSRYPDFQFPAEKSWAEAHPELFVLRFSDPTNVVFEFLPAAPGAGSAGAG